jgi:hypothetical protein
MPNHTAAWLIRYALEELGVRHTFGIPGVHNIELYDELASSESIEPNTRGSVSRRKVLVCVLAPAEGLEPPPPLITNPHRALLMARCGLVAIGGGQCANTVPGINEPASRLSPS